MIKASDYLFQLLYAIAKFPESYYLQRFDAVFEFGKLFVFSLLGVIEEDCPPC
jgi:hypothetical protein